MRTSIKEGVNNCVTFDSATVKGAKPDLDVIARGTRSMSRANKARFNDFSRHFVEVLLKDFVI